MKRIGVAGFSKSLGRERIFSALEEIFSVHFEECAANGNSGPDAWIINDHSGDDVVPVVDQERPSYIVIAGDQRDDFGESVEVDFIDHPLVPPVLRGRLVRSGAVSGMGTLPKMFSAATILATSKGDPVWVVRRSTRGSNHYFVSLGIPELAEHEPLYTRFDPSDFVTLLPLLSFLREVTEDELWVPPPLQACFMFDDPNLHWPTYGHIDFAEFAEHASVHRYHVAFATIPLDAWFVHERTADIFRRNVEVISLLMHGNDHVYEELARRLPVRERTGNLTQALDRIGAIERKSRVEISRVMAPPHGACSEENLKVMATLGYEAACISRGSLKHYNSGSAWVRTVGMRSCENIGGLPVFMRFRISATCENSILVAALLNQPIIPVGHHQDVAEGLDMFVSLANFINSLGEVEWGNMATIVRSHYFHRIDGETLHLRMRTQKAQVRIPDGVSQLSVDCSLLATTSVCFVCITGTGTEARKVRVRIGELLDVQTGELVDIALHETASSPREQTVRVNWFTAWAATRRLLTESRDRFQPTCRGLRKRLSAGSARGGSFRD